MIIPENPYRDEVDYLRDIVCADTYKWEMTNNEPRLRCYNKSGSRTDVFVVVEYPKGIDEYLKLPIGGEDIKLLAAWFTAQDTMPF